MVLRDLERVEMCHGVTMSKSLGIEDAASARQEAGDRLPQAPWLGLPGACQLERSKVAFHTSMGGY